MFWLGIQAPFRAGRVPNQRLPMSSMLAAQPTSVPMKHGQNGMLRRKANTPKKTQVKIISRLWEWMSLKKVAKNIPTFFAPLGIRGMPQMARRAGQ